MRKISKIIPVLVSLVILAVIGGIFYSIGNDNDGGSKKDSESNPLAGKTFYLDPTRPINQLQARYESEGKTAEAELISKAAEQPGSTWLTGPHNDDAVASKDISDVQRTAQGAAADGSIPVYILYAIPNRDACAGFSQGGFTNHPDYLAWIDRVIAAATAKSVFVVEPDAIAHTIQDNCLSDQQREERYALLSTVVGRLKANPHTLAIYLDAGNPEWFKNPEPLVQPLQKSGLSQSRGIAVNVSSFVATGEVTAWSKTLQEKLGSDKGVIIDTSRNGRGMPDASVTGDARWCNPPGRALGPAPTTDVKAAHVDAYFYGKNIGESDGDCFGNPPAGTFMPQTALELARNAD